MLWPCFQTLKIAGSASAARITMMPITTRSSISVKPAPGAARRGEPTRPRAPAPRLLQHRAEIADVIFGPIDAVRPGTDQDEAVLLACGVRAAGIQEIRVGIERVLVSLVERRIGIGR